MNIFNSSELDRDSFWHFLFNADSIAVIGANNNIGTWGFDSMKAALAAIRADARKRVYAVNPNAKEVQGVSSYNTVLDIPDPVELAIIVVRAEIAPAVLRQCTQKKVKAAVVISAGFAEVDEAGAKLQAELVEIAREGGIRFVGPNCVGHADIHTQVASAGVVNRIAPGPVALVTQSGTLGASIALIAARNGIGMSKFVSTGNEADLRLEDYIEFLAQDKDTHIIAAYIEGLREGRRFFELTKEITVKKPVVVIKTGTTSVSSQAAKSHTGALAGSDAIYSAAFKQAGVIRVEDEEELCNVVVALLNMPLPQGNGIGILTIGGGFGVVMAEACEKEGLKIASLGPQTLEKMNAILPARWSHSNPVDMAGISTMIGDPTVPACLRLLMEDKNVDVVISLLPPMMVPPEMNGRFNPEQIRSMQVEYRKHMDLLNQMVKRYGKPLILLRLFFIQPAGESNVSRVTPKERIPEYSTPRQVARVLRHLMSYRQYLEYRNT